MAVGGLPLEPAMELGGPVAWVDATWIGEIEIGQVTEGHLTLVDGELFRRCRLLVRDQGLTRGFVELSIAGGTVRGDVLRDAIEALPPVNRAIRARPDLAVTVAISTRNRADQLADALESLRQQTHPRLEVLIVDNASDDDATRELIDRSGDVRLRYVREERIGLSYGRNRALLEASNPVVAFTDDDVVVDRNWVSSLASGFESDIAVVTGMVPTGELRTPPQRYFELLTSWLTEANPRTFRLSTPPDDVNLFPLDAGRYGTGANFAVRRDAAIELGGFNEALGIGSPTHGGEDLDMFVRMIYAGHGLSYNPDALVWHRHRADATEIERAVRGYAVSFTAWMAALVENDEVRRDAVRLGAKHLRRRVTERVSHGPRSNNQGNGGDFQLAEHGLGHLPGLALRSLPLGPAAYLRSRRSGRLTRPLWSAKGCGA